MAQELRQAGIAAEAYVGGGGMRAQMKYADKRASPVAVIEGEDERARGVVTLKDLKLGAAMSREIEERSAWREARPAQVEAPRANLVAAVRALLQGGAP
jgi:histidyl-tRNA synthetase